MKLFKKISSVILALALTASSLTAFAVMGTVPGYKLVNTYDEAKGVIVATVSSVDNSPATVTIAPVVK